VLCPSLLLSQPASAPLLYLCMTVGPLSSIGSKANATEHSYLLGPHMLPSERSGLVDPSYNNAAKLPRAILVHLTMAFVIILVPLVLGIALTASERSSPDRIIPWSTAEVGFKPLKGDLGFALTQFALCNSGDHDQCTRLYYEDQKILLGDDADPIAKTGRAIYVLLIVATVFTALAAVMTLIAMIKQSGTMVTKQAKWATSALMMLALIFFFISGILWATTCHDRLSKYSTDLRYTWGFALTWVSGLLAGGASVIHCLRLAPDDYSAL